MIKLTEYSAYFEKLSRQHVDIKHNDSAPRFFRLKGRDVTTKLQRADNIILVLESPEFSFSDNNSDNIFKDRIGAFAILKRVKKLDDFIEQEDAVDECEQIAEEIFKLMRRDNKSYSEQLFGYLPINSFSGFKVGPVYDGFYGIRVEFKFGDAVSMCVDESKWNFNTGN